MVLKTKEDIKRVAAEMNDCTADQDMTFWQGSDGFIHATDEPRGTSADCLAAINCGGGMSETLLIEMLSERGVPLPVEPNA